MSTTPDNPRLTAYALDELDGEDRAEIESLLAHSEPARRFVADVRATSAILRDQFSLEPAPGLDDARRAAILSEETEPVAALRLHVDDAEERTDVYHVITHPGPGARRYRAELLAIAAAVAIVATALTLILSSLFRARTPANGPLASSRSPSTPQVPFIFTPGNLTIDKPPVVSEGFASHPPRELIAQMPADRDGPVPPFGVAGAISVAPIQVPTTGESTGTVAAYALTIENPFFDAGRNPLSTFAFNVGNSSYAAVRRALAQHQLPAKDAVRIEQFVNFFPYHYSAPTEGETFAAHIEVAGCPWQIKHRLVRIGLKGKELPAVQPIAEDVQIRVEFNPAKVGAYRLIGYDRRLLTRAVSIEADHHNQVTSGQSVTALYEIIPAGAAIPSVEEPLKYQKPPELTAAAKANELLTVQLRYVDPQAASAPKAQFFAAVDPAAASEPSDDFKFAAAVAAFGLLLRDSPHKSDATYDLVLALAEAGQHSDALGERAKFLDLIRQAQRI
jgi:hypothetical protein